MSHSRGGPKTLARRITATKSLFRWLHKFGVLVVDPAEKVAPRSAISPIPIVPTPKEYDEVLLAADRHRRAAKPDAPPYALVYLLLTTGIKKSETLGIKLEHLDLDSPNGLQVFIKYATPTNRYKERKLILPEDWVPAYEEYLAEYQPEEKLFPWPPRRLEYLLEDIGNEAGLTKHLSFDMCRWTFALNDFRAGEEPDKIRQKLGVSKIQGDAAAGGGGHRLRHRAPHARAARGHLVRAGLRRAPPRYLWYDLTHYATHHLKPRTALGEMQRRNHMVHHFKHPDELYGVTTPLWDFVFGTWPKDSR